MVLLLCAPPVRAQDAAHSPEPPNMAALVQAAAKEGMLDVAWGDVYGGAEGVKRAQDEIKKKYHIKLQFKYSPVPNGAAMQNQIAEEIRAGQTSSTDIFFHIRDRTWRSRSSGRLPEIRSRSAGELDVLQQTRGRRSHDARVVHYNTKDPAGEGAELLADLLRPNGKARSRRRTTRACSATTWASTR